MAVITISRLMGTRGDYIASRIAEKTGYDLVDSALIRQVAERAGVSVLEVMNYDEKIQSRAVEWLLGFISPKISKIITDEEKHIGSKEYIEYCKTVIRGLAGEGNMVIVGRGAQFILQDMYDAFHVRIIGDFESRVKDIAERRKISYANASERVKKSDLMRRHFVERHFHGTPEDTNLYHMIINSKRMDTNHIADIVADSARQYIELLPYVGGKLERRHGERRKKERRKNGDRRKTRVGWSARELKHALLSGRPLRQLNKPDRRQRQRRKGDRRRQASDHLNTA